MVQNVVIRKARGEDLSAVAKLIADNFDFAMPEHSCEVRERCKAYCGEDELRRQLAWKEVFVVLDGGRVAGTGALVNFGTVEESRWSISNFFIAPDLHGRRLGEALLKQLLALAAEKGIGELHVPSSRTALGFYRKYGFVKEAFQPEEDAALEITWLVLAPSPSLRSIPGIGKNIEQDLNNLGFFDVRSLVGQEPEELYRRDCEFKERREDRCRLYVFRLAVYYAEHEKHDPEKLKWWYWKDEEYHSSRKAYESKELS